MQQTQNSYAQNINSLLMPKTTEREKVLDLFAGCGGLSLGFEAAGFETIGFEAKKCAADTYNQNMQGSCECAFLEKGFDYPDAQIIIGGPPCQPFSVRGLQKGMEDARDGFPVFIDAVARLRPRLFLFENVKNLMVSHKDYLELVLRELRTLGYIVEYKCLNAVDYGVPQNRERLIVVGHKSEFSFPEKCSRKVTVGEAIGEIMYTTPPGSKFLTKSQDEYVARYEKASYCVNPRDLYPDKPARTITCRNLAGATSDMQRVKLPDGRRRRLLLREAARLQSFPDWFEFSGNETERFTQIGNAVPPLLSYHLAQEVKHTLQNYDSDNLQYISDANRMYSDTPLFEGIS